MDWCQQIAERLERLEPSIMDKALGASTGAINDWEKAGGYRLSPTYRRFLEIFGDSPRESMGPFLEGMVFDLSGLTEHLEERIYPEYHYPQRYYLSMKGHLAMLEGGLPSYLALPSVPLGSSLPSRLEDPPVEYVPHPRGEPRPEKHWCRAESFALFLVERVVRDLGSSWPHSMYLVPHKRVLEKPQESSILRGLRDLIPKLGLESLGPSTSPCQQMATLDEMMIWTSRSPNQDTELEICIYSRCERPMRLLGNTLLDHLDIRQAKSDC